MPKVGKKPLQPFWQTTDGETVKLFHGECRDVLRQLPAQSVQCVITSPPYWGLRDYGTAEWEGGDSNCEHTVIRRGESMNGTKSATNKGSSRDSTARRDCRMCGAKRIDNLV